jgi:hypothetical protein
VRETGAHPGGLGAWRSVPAHRRGSGSQARLARTALSGDRELQSGQFKSIFDGGGQVPTKGLTNTARFALGAVLVYQMALLYQYEHNRALRVGLKAFLKAA